MVHSVELIFLQVGDVEGSLPFYGKLGFTPRSRDEKGATLERGGTQIVLEAVEGYTPDPNEKVRASIAVPMEVMEGLWDEAMAVDPDASGPSLVARRGVRAPRHRPFGEPRPPQVQVAGARSPSTMYCWKPSR